MHSQNKQQSNCIWLQSKSVKEEKKREQKLGISKQAVRYSYLAKRSSIKYARKIFRKTSISNLLLIRGLEMLVFRKILRTYLMDGP